jgi:hypothetical protein
MKNQYIKMFENFQTPSADLKDYKEAYRWVGQPGLFTYFYGDHPELKNYVLAFEPESDKKLKLPKTLPPRIDIMEASFDGSICMTVDPTYAGEPNNGYAIIRIVYDLEKMLAELDIKDFTNLLTNSEAEFRYDKDLHDWTKYIKHIDIEEESYHDDVEDDFGVYRAIKKWLPKDINVKLFGDAKELSVGKKRIMDLLYDKSKEHPRIIKTNF